MARHAFFSFHFERDIWRANQVRNSWVTKPNAEAAGFIDAANFEKLKKKGDAAIRDWIDLQLDGTSVAVVLVGERTCSSRWVKYEIRESIDRGNGLLGIDISKIKDLNKNITDRCGKIPEGYAFYLWNNDKGYQNMGDWIEKAAKLAGR